MPPVAPDASCTGTARWPTAGRTGWRIGVSILCEDGRVTWIRPSDDEGPLADPGGVVVMDASGSTIVPGMVDAHSHLTMPGGAHWIDRGSDPTDVLLATAEANARLLTGAGVRWARDVGSPSRLDPEDGGRSRAVAIRVRDRWSGRPGYPNVRAAGTWIMQRGLCRSSPSRQATATELLGAAMTQLDDGADLVKLYLDGADPSVSPWTPGELRAVVEAVHARACRVTAHSGTAAGARAGAEAGVDALEHGFELDGATRRDHGRQWRPPRVHAVGARLVAVIRADDRAAPVRVGRGPREGGGAPRAGDRECQDRPCGGRVIATGTDFGGGSTRANQLAWEVEHLVEAGLEPWEALGVRDLARRRAARRAGRGRDPGGRAGGSRAGPRRSALGPDGALAGLAQLLGLSRPGARGGIQSASRSIDSPGARMRTGTSGARRAAASAKSWPGRSNGLGTTFLSIAG